MADSVSKETRSRTMRAIRSSKTSLEQKFSRALWNKGARFRRNVSSLKGKPDIAIRSLKVVIFLDSCFWHGCRYHCRMPSSRRGYWVKKIENNKNRDKQVNAFYRKSGWRAMRVWEHSIKKDFNARVQKAYCFINEK